MLYLSRLILDPRSRAVRRDLADCHQLHRTVLSGFPPAPAGASAREHFGLLYRIEPIDGTPTLLRLLLQSNHPPDWSHLPSDYLGPAPDTRGNPAVRSVSDEYAQLQPGMRLIFRLRANPTKRLSDRTPGRTDPLVGKRVALLQEADQLAWLARKGQDHGFQLLATAVQPELPDVRATAQGADRGRRPAPATATAMPLRFDAVLFRGRLEVTDRDALHAALAKGIGPGKAYGFGLLSVAAEH